MKYTDTFNTKTTALNKHDRKLSSNDRVYVFSTRKL